MQIFSDLKLISRIAEDMANAKQMTESFKEQIDMLNIDEQNQEYNMIREEILELKQHQDPIILDYETRLKKVESIYSLLQESHLLGIQPKEFSVNKAHLMMQTINLDQFMEPAAEVHQMLQKGVDPVKRNVK